MNSHNATLASKSIVFIGGGNMATAIVAGLINSHINPKNITVIDRNQEKRDQLHNSLKVKTLDNSSNLNFTPDIIILAVKPFVIKQACKDIAHFINKDTVIISVAAGVTLNNLAKQISATSNIIRAMPNTPATIQKGITILYQATDLTLTRTLADELFKAVGQTVWVDNEEQINTTMAISGCGPAYIFLLCESLMAAGNHLGIDPKISKQLITATLEGSAKLYETSEKTATTLRKEVTSPNGTTEQAINTLNPDKMKQLYTTALEAAVKKAKLIEQELLK